MIYAYPHLFDSEPLTASPLVGTILCIVIIVMTIIVAAGIVSNIRDKIKEKRGRKKK